MLTLPLGIEWIEARLPHGRRMCLLGRLVVCDASRLGCEAGSHRAADNPLRTNGRLGAACAVEYAAQAIALHGAVLRDTLNATRESGMLVAVRDLTLHVAWLDDLPSPLRIDCERIAQSARATTYGFTVACGAGRPVARGRATLVRGEPASAAA